MKHIAAFLILVLFDIPVLLFRGFVLVHLWEWFVTPLGVQSISIAHAIGLSLIINLLLSQIARKADVDNGEEEWYVKAISNLIGSVVVSGIGWGIGAVVHTFM
jgi:ACR3 family arsenite efflux pump ArsB